LRSPRDRFATTLATASQLLCDRFAKLEIALYLTHNRSAIALHSICNRFAIDLQSLCNHFAFTLQSLCNRFAIASRPLVTALQLLRKTLCDQFEISL
jgi:hypothetical protein